MNKGNCLFASGDYEKAREYYQEAYNVEASCTEALFNLGMLAAVQIYFNLLVKYYYVDWAFYFLRIIM